MSQPIFPNDGEQALRALIDAEKIKTLKARYARFVDTRDWTGIQNLFTPNADIVWEDELPGQGVGTVRIGPEKFVQILQSILPAGSITVHHILAPEISIDSPTTASGIWAMSDYVDAPGPGGRFRGYGHYHETYRKIGADWKISSWRLTRLRVDPFETPGTQKTAARMMLFFHKRPEAAQADFDQSYHLFDARAQREAEALGVQCQPLKHARGPFAGQHDSKSVRVIDVSGATQADLDRFAARLLSIPDYSPDSSLVDISDLRFYRL